MERKDVLKLAELVRIDFTDAEIEEFLASIEPILGYVKQLDSVMTKKYIPEAGDVYNMMREDKDPFVSGESVDEILGSMPAREGRYLKVKQIL